MTLQAKENRTGVPARPDARQIGAMFLVSLLIFGESMTWQQVVGGLCILGFTLWNERGESKAAETDSRD